MKLKVLSLLTILSSTMAYLEWGINNHTFLFEAEADILVKLFTSPASIAHPLIILPLLGQLLLLSSILFKKFPRFLFISAITFIGILLLFILVIGLIGLNLKMILLALPFTISAFLLIKEIRYVK